MTKRQLEDIQLPTEQYDPVTNWMADLPPLTKKTRAIYPRQRGNNNNNNNNNNNKQRQHQPQHTQHTAPTALTTSTAAFKVNRVFFCHKTAPQ